MSKEYKLNTGYPHSLKSLTDTTNWRESDSMLCFRRNSLKIFVWYLAAVLLDTLYHKHSFTAQSVCCQCILRTIKLQCEIKYALCKCRTRVTPSLDGCQSPASRCCRFTPVPLSTASRFHRNWAAARTCRYLPRFFVCFVLFVCFPYAGVSLVCACVVRACSWWRNESLNAIAGLVTFAVTNRHGVVLPQVRRLWMSLWWVEHFLEKLAL